ncbi:uncharacterized protein LOC126874754 [Bombus huntii]|uniref:uncharacterized protein LOC126874754 n=1 Tax=Bombus huntii TaxID=85661 RepID=UPI0021AA350C|nr:uncharacterized protein LOC126874754 [Bombus huntii]
MEHRRKGAVRQAVEREEKGDKKENKAFKQWCKQRKEKQEEEEMEKINKIKTEQEAWKYINKHRRRREVIDEDIREEKWKNYFMEMLEGIENQEDRRAEGWRVEEELKEEREDDIEKEEVIFQIRNLKEKKATGGDGLENEVWKYAPKEVEGGVMGDVKENMEWKGDT